MADKPKADDETSSDTETPAATPAAPAPRRGPGHRAADARDTAAEMAQRAHDISLEAGSKMAGVMREVIGAAAGLSAFAIESTRDLVHYMVRRGQMAQNEGDELIAQAEAAYIAKHGSLPKPEPKAPPPKPIPLGQLPKAVTAPAAAAEAALEARAHMRLEPQRTSDRVPLRPAKSKKAASDDDGDSGDSSDNESDDAQSTGTAAKSAGKSSAKTAGKSADSDQKTAKNAKSSKTDSGTKTAGKAASKSGGGYRDV